MEGAYFSDFFEIEQSILDEYGAFDISLINDLPLFIDPFLLFNSEDQKYQNLHDIIIKHMKYLKGITLQKKLTPSVIEHLFAFPEVKQNWLGFCKKGNTGHGLGKAFAKSLHRNFATIFYNFGDETVTEGSHIEKLCLISNGVGRDTISDFTTNLIMQYLAEYTQEFALKHLKKEHRKKFRIPRNMFNYNTGSWVSEIYELPYFNQNYVLLTPKNILTKDQTWINRSDMVDNIYEIANSLSDDTLRSQFNEYIEQALSKYEEKITKEERESILFGAVEKCPMIIDYYISDKEKDGDRAISVSNEKVGQVYSLFVLQVREFIKEHIQGSDFFNKRGESYREALERLKFLKDVIENKGGHKIFYINGKPISRESDLQILYRLTMYGTNLDVSREVNDGRGPADFKLSNGAKEKTIVEFKLAKNTHLERNLKKQTEIYERASDTTNPSIKVILYFTSEEKKKATEILKRLKMENAPNILLIDASAENKKSGSKA